MPLSVDDFIKQVKEEVNLRFDSYSYIKKSKDLAFTQWIMELLLPYIDPDLAFNSLNQNKSDVYGASYRDDESGTFYLFDAHYSDSPKQAKFGEGVFNNLLKTHYRIQHEYKSLLRSKTALAEAARAKEDGYTVIAILCVFGKFDDSLNISSLMGSFNVTEQQFQYYDISKLRRHYSGTDAEIPVASITLPFLSSAKFVNGPVQALIGNVAVSCYRDAINELIPQIYDVNLRNPLGITKINREMNRTIRNAPDFFWYYNNGVTMLCKGFHKHSRKSDSFIIESPRIVNGAQTTEAIRLADLSDNHEGALMVRVIAALPGSKQVDKDLAKKPDALEDLYLDIARYTNSQNRIEVADFRSNETVQKRLHEKFKGIGWFYERRRGQWQSADETEKKQYRKKRLDMINLAQRWFAFDGHPTIAIREKLSLFDEEGHYGNIFMISRSAEEYLVAYLLFGQLQDRLKDKIKCAKDDAQNSIDSSGRISMTVENYLMIGMATKLATAHMTALLGRALRERHGGITKDLSKHLISVTTNGSLVDSIYMELEDTLFRTAAQLRGQKKTLHRFLSEEENLDELYDTFKYVIDREKAKGRDVLAMSDWTQ